MPRLASGALRTWFPGNKGTKLLALLLAVATWYAIHQMTSYETIVKDVRVAVTTDEDWTVQSISRERVDVACRGSREDIGYLNRDQLSVQVDLRGRPFSGTVTAPLSAHHVNTPRGITPVSLRPNTLVIQLDRELEAPLPIKASFSGALPPGLEVAEVVCRPASARLRGPSRLVRAATLLRTQAIDLSERRETFTVFVPLRAPETTSGPASVEPATVEVSVTLQRDVQRTTLTALPIRVSLRPEGKAPTLEPGQADVTVEGSAERLTRLDPGSVFLVVDAYNLPGTGTFELPLRAMTPEGVRVVDIKPASVTLRFDASAR